MDDSLDNAAAVITLSRDELATIVSEAVVESRALVWRGFCFVLLLVVFAMFVGCVVVRDQVRARTAEMSVELTELRDALERAEMLAMSGRVDGAIVDLQVEVAHEIDRGLQSVALPIIAAPKLPSVTDRSAENEDHSEVRPSEGGQMSAATHEPTLAPALPVPVQLAPPIRERRPIIENQSVRGEPHGDDGAGESGNRPSNRGVTIPSPVERHESTKASAQRVRLSVGRGISFAPKRRRHPDVVVIRPESDVIPVAFEREGNVR